MTVLVIRDSGRLAQTPMIWGALRNWWVWALWVTSILDMSLTWYFVQVRGVMVEANPVMAYLLGCGLVAVVATKVVAPLLVGVVLHLKRRMAVLRILTLVLAGACAWTIHEAISHHLFI